MRAFFVIAAVLLSPLVLQAAEEVKASHILVRTQDEADMVRNEVMEKGGDRKAFMEAARKHSKDTTTKRAGGTLGWFTRQKMVREFSEAAFDMKVGEVSMPVKSQYGWHLIFLEDRREQQPQQFPPHQTSPDPAPRPETPAPVHPPIGQPAAAKPAAASPSALAPVAAPPAAAAPPATSGPTATATAEKKDAATPSSPAIPEVKVQPQKLKLPEKGLKLTTEVKERFRSPSQTVEVELTLASTGQEAQKVFSADLLPLGLSVTADTGASPVASWEELKSKKPENPIITLASRRAIGGGFSLNDYYKDLPPTGRYRVSWKPQVFIQNLDQNFPEISALPEAAAVKAAYSDGKTLMRDVVGLPVRQTRQFDREREVPFAVFEPISSAPGKKYFASLDLGGGTQPIWIELYADRQFQGVRQFANLALEGYYDGLELFDVQKGNFMRGGCPRNDGSGSPERTTFAQNTVKIPHEKGTISMVTRPTRLGSKEIGSIFFICRKPHPEWDEDHVPIGKIVAGEEVLDKLEGGSLRPVIRKASVVTGDKAPPSLAGAAAAPAAAANPKAAADAKQPLPPRGLPTAKVKTAKGEFAVELYEEDAPNTVANFIKLVEQGFFNPDPAAQKKEQTIYAAYPGTALITGSPTNDDQGGPGYRIANEAADNKKSHLKGTLTMLLETDPASGNPVPDSAGSQFMICLQDLPSWNGLYTPFGKVTEGAEVLDKLAQGDKIESITITSKRNRPYEVRKVNTGNVSFGNR